MRYGYDLEPHVSVLTRKRKEQPTTVQPKPVQKRQPGLGSGRTVKKVTVPFTPEILGAWQCHDVSVENLNLLHSGRDLKISGDYWDPVQKKNERIQQVVHS